MANVYFAKLIHKYLTEVQWKTPLVKCRSAVTLLCNVTIDQMKSLS